MQIVWRAVKQRLIDSNLLTLQHISTFSFFLLPQTRSRSRLGQPLLPRLEPWGLRCHGLKTHRSVLQNLFQALGTPLGILKVRTLGASPGLSLSLDWAAWLPRITTKVLRVSVKHKFLDPCFPRLHYLGFHYRRQEKSGVWLCIPSIAVAPLLANSRAVSGIWQRLPVYKLSFWIWGWVWWREVQSTITWVWIK